MLVAGGVGAVIAERASISGAGGGCQAETGSAAAMAAAAVTWLEGGTPEQVAESIAAYYALGVERFLLRGFDPLADARDFGDRLLPLVREMTAK